MRTLLGVIDDRVESGVEVITLTAGQGDEPMG
jgi:hypothetical protein